MESEREKEEVKGFPTSEKGSRELNQKYKENFTEVHSEIVLKEQARKNFQPAGKRAQRATGATADLP